MGRLLLLRLLGPLVGRTLWLSYPVASVAGRVAWHTQRGRRRNLIRNMLPLVDGDRGRARAEGLRAYQEVARYWVDLVSLPYRSMADFERDHLRIENDRWLAVLDRACPIIAVSAHTADVELAIQALTYRGRPFVALVEELDPPPLAAYLTRLRTAAGGRFYEANFAGLRGLLEAIERGEIVGMMGDRDLQGRGICVELAGRQVRLPRGPWELARRTGALVLPVFTIRERRDHFTVRFEEPFGIPRGPDEELDIEAAARRWAGTLEAHLRRNPGQWTVLEDFWAVHRCG